MSRGWHFIYGLFSIKKRECLYVGMSSNPIGRMHCHILNRTVGRKRFEFTILKRVKKRYAQREEAKYIAHFKSLGQAKFNRVSCSSSLTRTISNTEAIVFARDVKHGANSVVTPSDRKILMNAARSLRAYKVRNVRFKSYRQGKNFKLFAIVGRLQ